MRPVPERSHMLKTWPTKAGPPPFPLELIPAILTVDGNPELDSAEGTPLTSELDETESDSTGERVKESENLSGTQSLEVELGVDSWDCNGVVLGGARRERRLVVVVLMKLAMLWWGLFGSVDEAISDGRWFLPICRGEGEDCVFGVLKLCLDFYCSDINRTVLLPEAPFWFYLVSILFGFFIG